MIKMNKKGGEFSILMKAMLGLAVLLIMMSVLYGSDGKFQKSVDEFVSQLFIRANDVDQKTMSFHEQQDVAMNNYVPLKQAFKVAAESKTKTCVVPFPVIDEINFENEFKIEITKTVGGMSIQLSKFIPDEVKYSDDGKQKTDGYLAQDKPLLIDNFKPCIIEGESETKKFYEDFLQNAKINDYTNYGKEVEKITLKDYESMEVVFNNKEQKKYFYESGEDNPNYYVIKYQTRLCLIPTAWTVGWDCQHFNPTDDDCLDIDEGDITLPSRLAQKLIPICEENEAIV